MSYDLIIRGGTIIDGTGGDRFVGDIAILEGRIAKVGKIAENARREFDATGLVVAPGVVDLHTHYDAQLHWDPYCTASGWHGTTTAMIANCGFGFAPVRPGMSDRYMHMMENTEQVPFDVMKRSMSWDWETFPQWMAHLRGLPKGVNIATYLPMNALLSYIVGPDEAKRRAASELERAQMRELLHEALDAGAAGFSFSFLGADGNSHVDYDQSPMPTDVMAAEEAYNLADVLRVRNQGVIQILCELPGMANPRRDVVEELARRSGRPVFHNILVASDINPEQHRGVLRWLDDVNARGLNIWSQGFSFRKPLEIMPMHYNNWDAIPIFRRLSAARTQAEKVALVESEEYRASFEREYDPRRMSEVGGSIDRYLLIDAGANSTFKPFEGKTVAAIAEALRRPVTTTFLDILADTNMDVLFCMRVSGAASGRSVAEIVRHPRVLAGVSDGGAHSRHGNGGFWSTDMIMLLTRETNEFTLEQLHHVLSRRNAVAAGIEDRGSLTPGNFADIMVYDWAKLNYDPPMQYAVLHDLPGGDWRKVKRAVGIKLIVVNGEPTFEDGECTGATPGLMVGDAARADRIHSAAAAE